MRKTLVAISLIAFLMILVGFSAVVPANADEEGNSSSEQKESSSSSKFLKMNPKAVVAVVVVSSSVVFLLIGAFYKIAKTHDAKLEYYYRILGDESEAHFKVGSDAYNEGKKDKAIREFRRAISINPSHWGAHNALGYALMDKGDRAGAVQELRLYLQYSSDDESLKQKARDAIHKLGGTP